MTNEKYIKHLYTEEGSDLPTVPWNVYPRPQMRREEWTCLNGTWDIETESGKGKILVPFCPESLLSGFRGKVRYGEKLKYERRFAIPADRRGKRTLLHFGAVSRGCEVFVNDRPAVKNDNAYLPFSADISNEVKDGENVLTVYVENDLSPRYPYGKQKIDRGGMWYTPQSGIWQTVWLETVPETYVKDIKISPDMTGADIFAIGVTDGTLICDGKEYTLKNGAVRVEPDEPKLWSPEHPHLYEFTLKSGEDEVRSYFALRELSVKSVNGVRRLCLNGEPYFFNGLLDQGYFSDGGYTPASPALYTDDVEKMKELGFNTLRKHIKIEPERFYYDCDRLGMIVFQDMVNNGRYGFLHDTLLPTLGLKNLSDEKMNGDEKTRAEFISSMEKTVSRLYSHPCICMWTIFNEGWGQFCADKAYRRLKEIDKSRFVDATSGWFSQKESDVESMHIYFGKLKLNKTSERPQLLSEFGGYVYKMPTHSFNAKKTYGYKIFKTREEFVKALRQTYLDGVLPLIKDGLCGAIYTQLSDVEDETNGILTYDRKEQKLNPDEIRDVFELMQMEIKK